MSSCVRRALDAMANYALHVCGIENNQTKSLYNEPRLQLQPIRTHHLHEVIGMGPRSPGPMPAGHFTRVQFIGSAVAVPHCPSADTSIRYTFSMMSAVANIICVTCKSKTHGTSFKHAQAFIDFK